MSDDKAMPQKTKDSGAQPPAGEIKPVKRARGVPSKGGAEEPPKPPPPKVAKLFRPVDWMAFGISTLVTLAAYLITIAPDLTLEDCGELAVGSYYAGVPHAPGYPVWTIYSWLFTFILPFSNVAWRVAVSSAVAAAAANGLLALLVSRGSSMILEGIELLQNLNRRWENALCLVSGFVSAMLIGFNGFMWSQAVIVEVYTLSVLSLMGVLACLLRWVYAPHQHRYLYLGFFLFGISFNNHQTLIVAAMGLEVVIAMASPKLGRDMLLGNTVVYLLGLLLKSMGLLTTFDANAPLFAIYNIVGLASLVGCAWLIFRTSGILSEWKGVVFTACSWIAGAAFYLYMPITGATNPPMNWGYPRTFDGFLHAFTRGQYERTNPTNILSDPFRFIEQLRMYFEGATDEFGFAYILLASVPFFFLARMQRRERAWIVGNTAIYACLAFLLLILLNPSVDLQSRDLTKVFFTASHVTIAMFLGYGLTLIGAMLLTNYSTFRPWALYGAAVMAAAALYSLVARVHHVYAGSVPGLSGLKLLVHGLSQAISSAGHFTYPVYSVFAAIFVCVLTVGFLVGILLQRSNVNGVFVLGAFALLPLNNIVSHWAENEQRGHMFGFWFGHDMFTPPFGVYPEMTKDAILFGGTDPGLFWPSFMIFAESFVKPEHRYDPKFDRRDVYIITQNALADGTYLNYIRAHYNRSAQQDSPFLHDVVLFFQNMALGKTQIELKNKGLPYKTSGLVKSIGSLTNVVAPFDRLIAKFGKIVEDRRRREGVYPPKEILTPSIEDSQRAFQDYIIDAQQRLIHDTQFPNEPKQVRPGELVNFTPDGRIQVAGQVAVMAINGLLTKVIFEKNPTNEFFVEESFPLEWMFPYLSPYGIIMKINRKPVEEFTDEVLRKDHEFWTKYTERLCGNWITYDTPVGDICAFVERTYLRGDLKGYKGDPRFVRDNDAQKAFSKLRNSIAGLYSWRLNESKNPIERARVAREADFAFKQAFAFCPYSPETVTRYVTLLFALNRLDDALAIAQTCKKFDEGSAFTQNLIDQIKNAKQAMAEAAQVQGQLSQYEQQYYSNTNNVQSAFNLVGAYLRLQRTGQAFQVLDQLVARSNVDASTLLSVANAYVTLGQYPRVEPALLKLTVMMPESPEVWYDLAGAQTALGKTEEALRSLRTCLQLNSRRHSQDSRSSNLLVLALTDARFIALRSNPEYQALLSSYSPASADR